MEAKYLRIIAHGLILNAILLGLIAAALWLRADTLETRAQAQTSRTTTTGPTYDIPAGLPDAGKQRQLTFEALDALNRKMADLERGFREGSFVIQTIESKSNKPKAQD